MVIKNY